MQFKMFCEFVGQFVVWTTKLKEVDNMFAKNVYWGIIRYDYPLFTDFGDIWIWCQNVETYEMHFKYVDICCWYKVHCNLVKPTKNNSLLGLPNSAEFETPK